jgi:pyruvate dehydrogenase phosphatase
VSQKALYPGYERFADDYLAAVCLARNAMGGTRRGLFLGLLSLAGPLRRDAIDDTTVMVVFFDRQENKKQPNSEKKNSSWWPW